MWGTHILTFKVGAHSQLMAATLKRNWLTVMGDGDPSQWDLCPSPQGKIVIFTPAVKQG